jgi:hypothetical protein
MGVNGKSKGSTFERKIANLLSARFKEVTGIDQAFRRNPDSGSFFGGSNKKRVATHDLDHAFFGDLICPEAFKFSVECKHYKSGPTFSAIVKGKVGQWDEWIAQAQQDASNSNKEMMLIVKYNGVDEVVFLSKPISAIRLVSPYREVYGYRLDDFLNLDNSIFFNNTNSDNVNQQASAAQG